jgi:hypothetical protein
LHEVSSVFASQSELVCLMIDCSSKTSSRPSHPRNPASNTSATNERHPFRAARVPTAGRASSAQPARRGRQSWPVKAVVAAVRCPPPGGQSVGQQTSSRHTVPRHGAANRHRYSIRTRNHTITQPHSDSHNHTIRQADTHAQTDGNRTAGKQAQTDRQTNRQTRRTDRHAR